MSERTLLPALDPPLDALALKAAETAAWFGEQYEAHDADEPGQLPHMIVVAPTGAMEVIAFHGDTFQACAGRARSLKVAAGCATAVVCEAWVSSNTKELIAGSGVILPPRVDPNRTEAIMLQIKTPHRFVIMTNSIAGEGANKHLTGWRVYGDSLKGQSFVSTTFEPHGADVRRSR